MAPTAYVEVPEELAALPLDRHAIVEASAGTGKTHLLEHRLVDLVVSGRAEIGRVLVVTFTERATAELRTRVRALLARTRAAEPGPPPAGRHWVIDDAARERLRAALLAFDAAPIETIHAFCHQLLTRHAFAGGRLFEQRRIARDAAFQEAFAAALRAELAVAPAYRPALAAWLGSGERVELLRSVMMRADSARARLTPAWRAEDLSAALREVPPSLCNGGSLAAALIGGGVSGSSQKAITDRSEKLVAIARAHAGDPFAALAALGEDDAKLSSADFIDDRLGGRTFRPGLAADLAAWARRLRPHLVPLRAAVVQTLLPAVQARRAARKRREGLYDFDDMLDQVWQALCGPHGEELARSLRTDYPWALVDEFQDTDEVQWKILQRVFVDADGCRLCAIGDPKQAIYGFRAADVQTYLKARDDIAQRGGAVLPLVRNFRSTAPLIAAVNEILRDDAPSPLLGGEIRYNAPAVAAGGQSAVGPAASPPVVIWRLTPDRADAKLTAGALRGALGVRLTAEVKALLADPESLRVGKPGQERPIAARDLYVLARTTADAVEAARRLRGAGVPCVLFRSDGLFQSAEARAIRDLLAGIARPERRSDRAKAWRTPFFAVPLAALHGLDDVPESEPLLARLLGWRALADELRYEELFAAIVEQSGILRREVLLADGERALTNYLHLFELLLDEVARSRCDLPELVLRLQGLIDGTRALAGDEGDEQRLETEHAAVRIMTMHMAKGLEAAVVFLYTGFGPPPHDSVRVYHGGGERRAHVGKVRGEALQELVERERAGEDERLLYVALTRARARLYLPFVGEAEGPGWHGYAPLARRLADLVARAGDPAIAERFTIEPVVVPAGRGGAAAVAASAAAARVVAAAPAAHWTPPAELVAAPAAAAGPDFERLAARRRGPTLTSYTRMKSRGGGSEPEPRGISAGPDELPGGAGTGLLLHDLLERAPREGALAAASAEAWAAGGEIAAELREAMAARDIDPRWRADAAALAHRALTCPIALPGGGQLAGVASAARCLREVEFAFPIPAEPPWLGPPGPGGVAVGAGYVEGAIDVLLEHERVVYVIDWKSDLLADYSPAALAAHVGGHYKVQAQLYALAVARMLGLGEADAGRLGGIGFLFLRGLAPPEAGDDAGAEAAGLGASGAGGARAGDAAGQPGVYWITPTWGDLLQWAETLSPHRSPLMMRPSIPGSRFPVPGSRLPVLSGGRP